MALEQGFVCQAEAQGTQNRCVEEDTSPPTSDLIPHVVNTTGIDRGILRRHKRARATTICARRCARGGEGRAVARGVGVYMRANRRRRWTSATAVSQYRDKPTGTLTSRPSGPFSGIPAYGCLVYWPGSLLEACSLASRPRDVLVHPWQYVNPS
ncbi:hypothetical protein BC628DRAFT_439747 [Trametes gibbosa]|nr:hypothetical protein BC628DRAFT_439747 [Trametes gibbosa]